MDNSTECFRGLRLSLSHRGAAGQRYASLVRASVAAIMLLSIPKTPSNLETQSLRPFVRP